MTKLLDFTIKTAKKAGNLILKESKKTIKVTEKARHDLVTNVDKASEALIIKEIKKAYPDHAILAEESFSKQKSSLLNAEYIWLIDPIDGTTNFIHGTPLYSVSIAVFKTKTTSVSKNYDYLEGEIIAGIVHAPAMQETYYAAKGKGAYLNGKKIKVSSTKKLTNSLLVTGFPAKNPESSLPYFTSLLGKCQAIRRLGSAALDLCWVACGRFDGHWEFGLKPWDIAAGALIVNEAGGRVTDTNNNLLDLFGADILASNGKIHREMIKSFHMRS